MRVENDKERQQDAELKKKAQRELDKRNLQYELEILKDIKKVIATDEGLRVVKWILWRTQIFDDAFTGNSQTYYNLGIQHIGKKIICKLIDAGCDIKLTDLAPTLDDNKINSIHMQLNKLDTEDTK